jgi:hypothetical protein
MKMKREETFDTPKLCYRCKGTVKAGEKMIGTMGKGVILHHCEECENPKKKIKRRIRR